jgi:hypothetical protein
LLGDQMLDVAGLAARDARTSGLGDEIPPDFAINALLEARGLLRLAQGRRRQGLDDLVEFGRRDKRSGGARQVLRHVVVGLP